MKFARYLLVEAVPERSTFSPPPVEELDKENIEAPPKDPETETGTLNEAVVELKLNWLEVIRRFELPAFKLRDPVEVKLIEFVAERVVETPVMFTFPLVLCRVKFPPATMSSRSPGTTNLRP
jgi:hypothetical protein